MAMNTNVKKVTTMGISIEEKYAVQRAASVGLLLLFCAIAMLFSGCYKEQHFGFPGPFDEEQQLPDSLPFPFDPNREAGIWLMRNGVPDHERYYSRDIPIFIRRAIRCRGCLNRRECA